MGGASSVHVLFDVGKGESKLTRHSDKQGLNGLVLLTLRLVQPRRSEDSRRRSQGESGMTCPFSNRLTQRGSHVAIVAVCRRVWSFMTAQATLTRLIIYLEPTTLLALMS